jgi:hypothetical protein
MAEKTQSSKAQTRLIGQGMALGTLIRVAVGAGIGAIMGGLANIGVWVGFGVPIGLAVGFGVGAGLAQRAKKPPTQ